jgi:hypothetical protein
VTNADPCFTLIPDAHHQAGWRRRRLEPEAGFARVLLLGEASEVLNVSIVRIGLAETKQFADGYDAIFGKRQPAANAKPKKAAKKPAGGKAKSSVKKKKRK